MPPHLKLILSVLALALCCAVPRGVAGYMAEIKPSGAANAGTGATGVGIGDEVQGFNAGGDSAGEQARAPTAALPPLCPRPRSR